MTYWCKIHDLHALWGGPKSLVQKLIVFLSTGILINRHRHASADIVSNFQSLDIGAQRVFEFPDELHGAVLNTQFG